MKKSFKFYLIAWAILLVLFNIIAFISPGWTDVPKYTPSFWIGYVAITLAFIGQIFCAFYAFKEENLSKFFYSIPVITFSYTGLIVTLIIGSICMIISNMAYWIGIILCSLTLAITAIAVVKATAASEMVSDLDTKIKAKTFFIRSATADAQALVCTATDEQAKAELHKLYEAFRYSDPMQSENLANEEMQITLKLNQLKNSEVKNFETVSPIVNELIVLINARNAKCKFLK